MTIREAIKDQRKAMKNRTVAEKFSYFREYYGIRTVCLITALILLVSFCVGQLTKKDTGFHAVFFGGNPLQSSDAFLADFADAAQIDTGHFEVTVQTSLDIRMDDAVTEETYIAMQSFAAMVAAGMVDNIAADIDLFLYYSYLGYTVDLRTVLTEQQLADFAPHLCYIDAELLRQQENSETGLTFEYGQCPDPKKPELMTDPIPVAIDLLSTTPAFQSSYAFGSDTVCIGICASSERPDTARRFLQFMLALPIT